MGKRPVVKPDWLTRSLQQRFDEKWMPEPNSGCWLWIGAVNHAGYGRISYKLKPVQAQRISLFLKNGVMPPPGIDVCHRCDTPSCVNPDHLFIGTRRDNVLDAINKGRKTYPLTRSIDWRKVRKLNTPLKQSMCIREHSLLGDNLYISPDGQRACIECRNIRMRARWKRLHP